MVMTSSLMAWPSIKSLIFLTRGALYVLVVNLRRLGKFSHQDIFQVIELLGAQAARVQLVLNLERGCREDFPLSDYRGDFPNLQVKTHIGCNCPRCQNSDDPALFSDEDVQVAIEMDERLICNKSRTKVSCQQLLLGLEPELASRPEAGRGTGRRRGRIGSHRRTAKTPGPAGKGTGRDSIGQDRTRGQGQTHHAAAVEGIRGKIGPDQRRGGQGDQGRQRQRRAAGTAD